MKTAPLYALLILACCATCAFAADGLPEFPQPEKEHKWLEQFVGEWTTTGKSVAAGDQPAVMCAGKATVKMLGGFWVVSEITNEMMGMKVTAFQTLGYDAKKKKYIGTWVDSMMNHLWHYEGSVDETGKILTLDAEGPNLFEPGKTAKYRDTYEIKSKDKIVSTSLALGADGKWTAFMHGEMERVKQEKPAK